jgi:hypothetical protein
MRFNSIFIDFWNAKSSEDKGILKLKKYAFAFFMKFILI